MKRLALVAVALLALGAWLLLRDATDSSVVTPAAEATRAASASQASGACQFSPGAERGWWVRSISTLRLDAAAMGLVGAPGSIPDSVVEQHAFLQVQVLEASGPSAVLLARYADEDETSRTQAGNGLDAPFLLRVKADCALTGYARLAATPRVAARAQQALAHELWFSAPADTQPVTLEATDGTGRYRAIVASDGSTARRRVQHYTAQWPTGLGEKGARVVEDALLTVQRDEGPWFQAMQGRVTLSGQALPRVTRTLAVELRPKRADLLEGAPREQAAYVWEDLLPQPQTTQPTELRLSEQDRRERAELAALSMDEALDRFAARIQAGVGFNRQWPELRNFLEARPDQIPALADALASGDFPDEARPAAYLALGKARVPEARDALLAINRNPKVGPMHRVQTALLLADRSDTPPAFAKELRAASQALTASEGDALYGRNAVLALGMFAGRQGSRDESISAEARGAVEELLSRGNSAAELSPAFGAMGNLGDPAMLPRIVSWSQHRDANVRAAVPMALRRLSVEVETPLLQEWLGREGDKTVRRELWSLLYRQLADEQRELPQAFVPVAIRELRSQPDLLTRQPLVRLLVPAAQHDAQAKQALLDQLIFELNSDSGLIDVLQAALPGDEVSAALRAALKEKAN